MTETINGVPLELLKRAVQIPSKASVEENHAAIVDRGRAQAELRDMLSSLEVAPGACGCTDLCKERGLASDEVSKSCHAVYGGVTP